jgi:hypothetical protein
MEHRSGQRQREPWTTPTISGYAKHVRTIESRTTSQFMAGGLFLYKNRRFYMKYRKKPVVVDAFQLTDYVDMVAPDWFTEAVNKEDVFIDRSIVDGAARIYGCTVMTHEEQMRAKLGDYIIRGVNGELYPCKSDIFEKTYEKEGGETMGCRKGGKKGGRK